MNDILFIPIWISDWNKFLKIINILNTLDMHLETNKSVLSIFDNFIHLEKNKKELNTDFKSIFFNYYYKRGLLIQHIYNIINNDNNFNKFNYFSFIFEDDIDLFKFTNINNIKFNFLKDLKNIYYIENLNIYIFSRHVLNLFINYIQNNENINDIFFLEKIYNIFNIESFKNSQLISFPQFNIFNNFYNLFFSLSTLNNLKKYTFIIKIDNIKDFNIKYLNLLLYLPLNHIKIFIVFDKKLLKKELIFQELKILLNKYIYIYLIYEFPESQIENCIDNIINFTNFKDVIYNINMSTLKKSFDENNLNSFFEKLENIFLNNNQYINNLNNINKLIKGYKEEDYFKLFYIDKKNINYIMYNKKFLETKTILNLKKKWIENNLNNEYLTFENKNLLSSLLHQNEQSDNTFTINNIDICDNNLKNKIIIEIINLEKRYDRYCYILEEFDLLNIEYNIFKGIKTENIEDLKNSKIIDYEELFKNNKNKKYILGSYGCKMSHIELLKKYENNQELDYLLIFEDDFTFYNLEKSPFFYINNALKELLINNIDWNILYLNTTNYEFEYSEELFKYNLKYLKKIKNKSGFTTSSYIIPIKKINYILNILYENLSEIDVVYTNYIKNRFMILPQLGYQREDFSDILHKNINYNYM